MTDIASPIIDFFYPAGMPLRRVLLAHSMQVREKALTILARPECAQLGMNSELVANGAMLHDIGILHCHAPKIFCMGTEPYLAHGIIGGRMLREYGLRHGIDLEAYACICERHTGSGITAVAVRRQRLPIPERDYLPETAEEKLICLADKFYSKSGDMQEKPLDSIRRSMLKFGADSLVRFDDLCRFFEV